MKKENLPTNTHPAGEPEIVLDSYGGVVRVSWEPEANVTQFGQLGFFVEFLKVSGLYQNWVSECPLLYKNKNGSRIEDILGTLMLSILAGHSRYSHVTSIRSDTVTPQLLGMSKVVSEDSVRRALLSLSVNHEDSSDWLKRHLLQCASPLLSESWILDIDTTVKPLYGRQEGAVKGYNPQKPGRPSHVYHSYFVGNLRLILDAEVHPGNESSAKHSQDGLWQLIDSLPQEHLPKFIRGDCAYGNERILVEAEAREMPYLTKLRQSPNVKRLIQVCFNRRDWQEAGCGWEGVEDSLQLDGWTKNRRVIVLRRRVKESIAISSTKDSPEQGAFLFMDNQLSYDAFEYMVLVTSLPYEILTIAQLYRDRADMENIFDEMKNQWSWGGFTTQDLGRCQLMARIAALIFNWWSLFSGLAFSEKHAEAITTRPLLLHAIGRQTSHAGQKKISITSSHAQHGSIRKMLESANRFFNKLKFYAEQMTQTQVWGLILSRIFFRFLRGKVLGQPPDKVLAIL